MMAANPALELTTEFEGMKNTAQRSAPTTVNAVRASNAESRFVCGWPSSRRLRSSILAILRKLSTL
jgi:hypothetical protein